MKKIFYSEREIKNKKGFIKIQLGKDFFYLSKDYDGFASDYERKFACLLEQKNIVWQYEPKTWIVRKKIELPYLNSFGSNKASTYTPDFIFRYNDKIYVIEVKTTKLQYYRQHAWKYKLFQGQLLKEHPNWEFHIVVWRNNDFYLWNSKTTTLWKVLDFK